MKTPTKGHFLFEPVLAKNTSVNRPKTVTNFQGGLGIDWCGLGVKNGAKAVSWVLSGVFDS